MNRLFIAAIVTYLIIRLISSCGTRHIFEDTNKLDPESGIGNNVTGSSLPVKIDSFNLIIIPPSSGVQFYREGIVFLALTKNEGKMLPGHLSFGTIQAYYAILKDTTPGQHLIFAPSASFPYPCEALTFSGDFNTMYFTRRSTTGIQEKIYHAELISVDKNHQRWLIDDAPLGFCLKGSRYSHPSVSVDGKIMIFASDSPGSVGGMDLFITRKEGLVWTDPKNIGNYINTKGNELFPFLDTKNNLFFSSDGLPGYGGYDLFISKFNGTGWEKPLNLTKAFNSKEDEIAFTMNRKDGKSAFFTTKQRSGNGRMQLFRVRLKEEILNDDTFNLTGALYSIALSGIESNELTMSKSKLRTEKMKTDSIEAARIKAERIKFATIKKDNIVVLNTEADKIKAAKIKADSIEAAGIAAKKLKSNGNTGKNVVIYKVQIASSIKSKGISEISVNGKKYTTFEYFYLGEYRYTLGEFSTLKQATEFQSILRKSVYPNAFIVAFRNNVRSNDPGLFKKENP